MKILSFKTEKIDTCSVQIQEAIVVKVFHTYQCRNEWINWAGDTSIMRRRLSNFEIGLRDASDSAEEQRTKGTKFVIDETPAICIIGKSMVLIATEIFNEYPFQHFEPPNNTPPLFRIKDAGSILGGNKWFAMAVYTGELDKLCVVKGDETFYSRTSSSSRGKSLMGWSLKPRKINLKGVNEVSTWIAKNA